LNAVQLILRNGDRKEHPLLVRDDERRRSSYVKEGCCTVKGCARFVERRCVWGVAAWRGAATIVRAAGKCPYARGSKPPTHAEVPSGGMERVGVHFHRTSASSHGGSDWQPPTTRSVPSSRTSYGCTRPDRMRRLRPSQCRSE
ncbi:hypothetical protein M514_23730, partial [Trichuris suis]